MFYLKSGPTAYCASKIKRFVLLKKKHNLKLKSRLDTNTYFEVMIYYEDSGKSTNGIKLVNYESKQSSETFHLSWVLNTSSSAESDWILNEFTLANLKCAKANVLINRENEIETIKWNVCFCSGRLVIRRKWPLLVMI